MEKISNAYNKMHEPKKVILEDGDQEVKEFNDKRTRLEGIISKAEDNIERIKNEEGSAEDLKKAKDELSIAWKKLAEFDPEHFEAKMNEDKDDPKEEPKVEPKAQEAEIATEPKDYIGFTGKIRTNRVYGTVEDATFKIKPSGCVEFKNGTWVEGTWTGSFSLWLNGTWKNGTWDSGQWYDGTWENGTWKNGVFGGGTWKNGTWKNGNFDGGVWEDGVWLDGEWEYRDAKWITGKDKDGKVQTNPPNKWAWKYSRVKEVPTDSRDQRDVTGSGMDGVYKKGEKGIDTFDDDPNKEFTTSSFEKGVKNGATYGESISESVKKNIKSKIFKKMLDCTLVQKITPPKCKNVSEEDETDISKKVPPQVKTDEEVAAGKNLSPLTNARDVLKILERLEFDKFFNGDFKKFIKFDNDAKSEDEILSMIEQIFFKDE